jgi:hypothetical protein
MTEKKKGYEIQEFEKRAMIDMALNIFRRNK